MVSTSTEACSREDENAKGADSTGSPMPKPHTLAGGQTIVPHAEKLDHQMMQDKTHHSKPPEVDEKQSTIRNHSLETGPLIL